MRVNSISEWLIIPRSSIKENIEKVDMSRFKTIVEVIKGIEQSEGVGARVVRTLGQRKRYDPFLMLDQFLVTKGGFPDHPHRGFETITYMLEGIFQHEDFKGHKGEIGPGDIQWMTAGKGIIHTEMPKTTPAHGFQLWINLPAKSKMAEPKYQEMTSEEIPTVTSEDGKTSVKFIAGSSLGIEAKIKTNSPFFYLDVTMKPNATFEQPVPSNWNSFVVPIEGSGYFGPSEAKGEKHSALLMSQDGEVLQMRTKEDHARFLLIGGKPINEPVAQYGPFVMNTMEEIQQTMSDYQNERNGFEGAHSWASKIGATMR
jgi:quercetin 2,3-dioxygenase